MSTYSTIRTVIHREGEDESAIQLGSFWPRMIISHTSGNLAVRHVLRALEEADLLDRFYTTVAWNSKSWINYLLPRKVSAEFSRRSFPQVPKSKIYTSPVREVARLLAVKMGWRIPGEAISLFKIASSLDSMTARAVEQTRPRAVYAYEGAAIQTFRAAKKVGTTCIYELPSGYWYYEIDLLREEAELQPEYAGTIQKLADTREYLQSKDEEIALADHLVIPSLHVKRTLARANVPNDKLVLAAYGANEAKTPIRPLGRSNGKKLRVLFVGALTQRKGISYLIDAAKLMGSNIELTFVGRKAGHSKALDAALKRHRWIPSLPYPALLEEMTQNDVMVLPSLSEGFALVIAEALSRGLPVITTRNSGGEEIVRDNQEGYLVPLRSPEAIAERLQTLDQDRDLLDFMSQSAVLRAHDFSWQRYREVLVSNLQRILDHANSPVYS